MHSVASWPLFWITFVVWVVCFLYLITLHPEVKGELVPDLNPGWDLKFLNDFYGTLSPGAKEAYQWIESWSGPDFWNPLARELAFSMLLALLYPVRSSLSSVYLVPWINMFADFAENYCIKAVITNYPAPPETVYRGLTLTQWATFGSTCTYIKFGAMIVSFLLLIVALIKKFTGSGSPAASKKVR